MASRFSFVERNRSLERKSREQELDDLRRELAVMGGPPLSQRVLDTGTGGNGRVDVNKPTHMLNTNFGPRTVHEGERVNIDSQTGQFQVTPASQLGGQENLQRIEKATGMPGFQAGRYTGSYAPPRTTTEETPRLTGSYAPPAPTPAPADENITAGGIGVASPQPQPINVATPVFPPDENITAGGIGVAQPLPQPITPPATPILPPPEQGVAGGIGDVSAQPRPITPAPTPALPPPPTPEPAPFTYEPFATRALQRLERYGEGRDPFAERIRGAERERFAGEAAAARGALGQEMGQLGIGGREALTAQARLGRQIGADEATLMAELRTQEADRAFQAATALPGAVASAEGQRAARDYFNLAKSQDDYKRMTDAFNALAEAGNFDEAATMFSEMFPGSTIDLSKLETEEARLDFSKGMGHLTSYVASGLTWDEAIEAMRQDGTIDLLGMDEGSVNSMYNALVVSTDDVGRWTKNQSDDRLQAMFPDLWEQGGREAIEGKLATMHFLQAITFDENGKLAVNYDLLEEILGEGAVGALPGVRPAVTGNLTTDWASFNKSQEAIPEGDRLGFSDYQKLYLQGKQYASYNKYVAGEFGEGGGEGPPPPGSLADITGRTTSVLDVSEDNKATVANALHTGNQFALDHYGTTEEMPTALGEINITDPDLFTTTEVDGQSVHRASKGETQANIDQTASWTDVEKNIGKVFTQTDADGNRHVYVLTAGRLDFGIVQGTQKPAGDISDLLLEETDYGPAGRITVAEIDDQGNQIGLYLIPWWYTDKDRQEIQPLLEGQTVWNSYPGHLSTTT